MSNEKYNNDKLPRTTTGNTSNTAVSQGLPFKPHTSTSIKVIQALNTDVDHGLTERDAMERLGVYGPNRLKPPKRPSVYRIIVRQVANAMTVVLSELYEATLRLVAAMAVSFGTMDWISGGVIAALVILNVTVGTYTEWQAEKVGTPDRY
jgi:P-type Na+/K+ transporter